MLLNSDMHGKVVAIAGACSHRGSSIARSLAGKGAILMLGDRHLPALHTLVNRIVDEGGSAQYRATDPMRPASINMLVAHTLDAYGRVDLLLNFGANPGQPLANHPGMGDRLAGPPAHFPLNTVNSLSWLPLPPS